MKQAIVSYLMLAVITVQGFAYSSEMEGDKPKSLSWDKYETPASLARKNTEDAFDRIAAEEEAKEEALEKLSAPSSLAIFNNEGRYSIIVVPTFSNGKPLTPTILRLDTKTGEVVNCERKSAGSKTKWVCK